MQFKDIFRALILSAISCTIVFSCITADKSVGSDFIPNEHILHIKRASFRLPVGLKMLDSLQGVSDTYITVGAFETEEFGVAKFGSAGNIAPTSTTLNLGKDARIISTYLSIPLSTQSTVTTSNILSPSQEGIAQNFNVYRLKRTIDSTTLFANSLTANDYDSTPLNTSALTYFGGDSIFVYLDNSLGAELLTASENELDSLDLFAKKFKGLYIKCDDPIPGMKGGRLSLFEKSSAYLYLKYNFQPTWEEGLERKDTLISLSFGYNYILNTAEYSSKSLETSEPLEILPIEGMGGINPYIDAKSLKDTLDAWAVKEGYDPSKIIIAKASLVFPFELPQNTDIISYSYPSYLFPAHRKQINDTTRTKYYYPFDDYNSTDNPLGIMNRSLMQYECDFSTTIQQIINKNIDEIDSTYNIWLYPLMSETDSYYGYTYYYINNYNYFNAKINGPKAERYPELKIVYAVIE